MAAQKDLPALLREHEPGGRLHRVRAMLRCSMSERPMHPVITSSDIGYCLRRCRPRYSDRSCNSRREIRTVSAQVPPETFFLLLRFAAFVALPVESRIGRA